MKFIVKKNIVSRGKVIPAGESIDLDENQESTKALLKSKHIEMTAGVKALAKDAK